MSGKPDIARVSKFMELLHAFQLIERTAHVPNSPRRENDVEHSYTLSMLAWYLIDSLGLPLNRQKVFEYGLAHDLVEVYAGDTYFLDEKAKETKVAREEAAQAQIRSEFPEFGSLHEAIEAYEAQDDGESRFVRALDKLAPVITNYIQEGRTWKEMGVAFDELVGQKREKIGADGEVRELFEQLVAIMEREPSRYFPK